MNPLPEPLIHFLQTLHNLPTSTQLVLLPPDYDKPSIKIPTPFREACFIMIGIPGVWPEVCGECPPVASFPAIEVPIVPLVIRLLDHEQPIYFIHGFSISPPILAISQLNKRAPETYDPQNYASIRL